jgi:DNA-binding CsgD family transcriptional regulator
MGVRSFKPCDHGDRRIHHPPTTQPTPVVGQLFALTTSGSGSTPWGDQVIEPLAPREHEVLRLLAEGAMYKQVARKLDISMNTVLTHVRRIHRKLHVNSRRAAVERFKQL